MKGYKAFDKDLKCRDTKYKVGEEFEVSGKLEICKNGIHFCANLKDVYNYYPKNYETRVCEVEAIGEVQTKEDKSVCLKLRVGKELNKEQIKQLTDDFRFNSGSRNSGSWNSGYGNSGDGNSGDGNSGDGNSGSWNSGYGNSGDGNSGDGNSGDGNSGDGNSGDGNSGSWNSGSRNSGSWNSGSRNSGSWNSGDGNSGFRNSGYGNSGDGNSGDGNSGSWNSGSRNSGYGNSGDGNSGYFNTILPKVRLFNKETELDENSEQLVKIRNLVNLKWKEHLVYVYSDSMTEQEKKDHPYHITTGGFIRKDAEYSYKKSWERLWKLCSDQEKELFKSLPNFDSVIFEEITGIDSEDMVTITINGIDKKIKKRRPY